MRNASDFIIENSVLTKYVGAGGDVIIPEGVVEIGSLAFAKVRNLPNGRTWVTINDELTSVTLADSVEHIGDSAFKECENLQNIVFSPNLKTIGDSAFYCCHKLEKIILPGTLERVGRAAFFGHMTTKILEIHSKHLSLPEGKLSIFQNAPIATADDILFAPHLSLSILKDHGLGIKAAKTFVKRHLEYDANISEEYISYIASQKKTLLPFVLDCDAVGIIQALFDGKKITKKNYERDYLLPAKQSGASKCEAFLTEKFAAGATEIPTNNALCNGENFSFDGKQLLKYKEDAGCDTYYVPEGTKEICNNAFFMTSLRAVFLPESVKTIRNGAFVAKGGRPLFVKLPDTFKKLSSEAFMGGFWDEDDGLPDSQKYYYIATSSPQIAAQTSCSSYNKGEQCPVYTGGSLDDLPPKVKPYAVRGFLYAAEFGLADLSEWKESYCKHIKENEKTYLKLAGANTFLLHLMIQEKLLSPNGVKKLMQTDTVQKNAEALAALLNYQNEHCAAKNRVAKDPLADDSAEMKGALKKQKRLEQIQAQEGIAGIIFVASGDLKNFGAIDEYTGAHDLSDLKSFIEARGGFLRSAVSSKTDYLICNDTAIQTTKVQKAKELGTAIISESEFLEMAK